MQLRVFNYLNHLLKVLVEVYLQYNASKYCRLFFDGSLLRVYDFKNECWSRVASFLYCWCFEFFYNFFQFCLDVFILVERGNFLNASMYILSSVVLSIFGLFAGIYIMRSIIT